MIPEDVEHQTTRLRAVVPTRRAYVSWDGNDAGREPENWLLDIEKKLQTADSVSES